MGPKLPFLDHESEIEKILRILRNFTSGAWVELVDGQREIVDLGFCFKIYKSRLLDFKIYKFIFLDFKI